MYLSTLGSERSFNYRLLEQGYARLYDTPFSNRDAFADAEARARDARRGVWSFDDNTDSQTTVRSRDSALELVEINADAAGNDNENLDDEYPVFENTGAEPLELSGWTVSDSAGHTFTVPDGIQLGAGERLRLVTGSGTDTDSTLYWGEDQALWNNGGETVTVRTAGGKTVLRQSY